MEIKSGVNLVYKNLGETPHEAILRFKKENPQYENEPMTYAGRLDPMAEGLLLVLSGEKLHHKEDYLNLAKTYEFEVLWGFETDTLDLLGLVTLGAKEVPSAEEVKKHLKQSAGRFEQKYPAYSSKPVQGKPLFQWAREGKLNVVAVPTHEVELYVAEVLSRRNVSGAYVLKNIEKKIGLVKGDFRQKEILEKWRDVLREEKDKEFTLDKITVTVSSGFYVRQLVSDLGKNFTTSVVTFSIKRTKVGSYAVE
jgi:tRNA pseudouridine(55) synthase